MINAVSGDWYVSLCVFVADNVHLSVQHPNGSDVGELGLKE